MHQKGATVTSYLKPRILGEEVRRRREIREGRRKQKKSTVKENSEERSGKRRKKNVEGEGGQRKSVQRKEGKRYRRGNRTEERRKEAKGRWGREGARRITVLLETCDPLSKCKTVQMIRVTVIYDDLMSIFKHSTFKK